MRIIVIGAGYWGSIYIRELGHHCVGVVEPDKDHKENNAVLAVLNEPTDREKVAPRGSFGHVLLEFTVIQGKPALIIDEVQSSRGYRKLRPTRVRDIYRPWAESVIAKIAAKAEKIGIELIYASTQQRIMSRYEYEALSPVNLWENYEFPFKRKG